MRYQFFSRLTINSMLILSAISGCSPIYAENSVALLGNNQDVQKSSLDNATISNDSKRYGDDSYYNSAAYKILDEFKEYIRNTPEHIHKEISDYRSQLNNLNKQKKEYYNKLSMEAQTYLKKACEFKAKIESQTSEYRSDSESQDSTWDAAKEKMKEKTQDVKEKMKEMKEKIENKMKN